MIASGGKKTMPHQKGIKTIAQNRKAWHDYFVEDKVECGVVLFGTEVKSVRQGRVNLKESWVRVHNGEVWAEGMHISPYEQGNQIRKLDATVTKQGYTLIPLELYLKDGRVKMSLGICRGKQLHDKRDSIAKRDSDREIQRALRNRQR